MIRRSTAVAGSIATGLALVLSVLAIPYQLSQQIQQALFGANDGVNQPFVLKPAYATSPINNIFVSPSDNTVGGESFYSIGFSVEATGQSTAQIQVAFPSGFNVKNVHVIQDTIGLHSANGFTTYFCPTLTTSNNIITCMIINPQNQISGTTQFMLDFSGIQNGFTKSNQVSITLIDDHGVTTFGPTLSPVFTLSKITGKMISNNAITSSKIASNAVTLGKLAAGSVDTSALGDKSVTATKIGNQNITSQQISPLFIKHVIVPYNNTQGIYGWNPDNAKTAFNILDSAVNRNTSNIIVNVQQNGLSVCSANLPVYQDGMFYVDCYIAPDAHSSLHYTVINMKPS